MEAALGVSYPTVKGHLASIKEKLNLTRLGSKAPAAPGVEQDPGRAAGPGPDTAAGAAASSVPGGATAEEVLDALEQGRISYKDAVRLLRAAPPGAPGKAPPKPSAPKNPPDTSARKKEDADEQQPGG